MSLSDHPYLRIHVGKTAILDSNLLLLHWCIRFNPSLIHTFKRLNGFRLGDFDLLIEMLKLFPQLKTTPHVLTEVSNLSNSLPYGAKQGWFQHFSRQVQTLSEEWTPAITLGDSSFLSLGLTDAVLAGLASTHVILTIDFPLSGSLQAKGLSTINFTQLRNSLL